MMLASRRDVNFPASDGIILKGWFFPAGKVKGPCVILTCGVSIPTFQLLTGVGLYVLTLKKLAHRP